MLKYLAISSLTLLVSLNASADFIYANDFTLGQDVSHITSNATLNWLEGTGNSLPSTIVGPGTFYNQHFGSLGNATTYETIPGLLNESLGSPKQEKYAALEINFTNTVRSFGFKAENHTSSPFAVFLYDKAGNFLNVLTAGVTNTGTTFPSPGFDLKIFDATYNYNFDVDVGKIRIGGASDGGYIYALNVNVPEPSALVLLFAGLFSILGMRRVRSA